MAQAPGSTKSTESLDLKTLVIAALASATAAIVVSHIWKGGTVIAAAMTPVIVAIAKEAIARPMESEIVKKPVQQVSRLASGRRAVAGGAATSPGRAPSRSPALGEEPYGVEAFPPTEPRVDRGTNGTRSSTPGAPVPDGDGLLSPMRTYGGSGRRRRPIHLKVAIVTGLIAFAIAVVVLTVPELIFGAAVTSSHSTTLFGGGDSTPAKTRTAPANQTKTTTQASPQSQQQHRQTTPATPPPTTGAKTPTTTTPAPSSATPQQTTTSPSPTPQLPPSGGTPPAP